MKQKIADLNKKIESLTKSKVYGDVEQALRNVRKAVARAPESFDPTWPYHLSRSLLMQPSLVATRMHSTTSRASGPSGRTSAMQTLGPFYKI